ncbi:MAG: T9SS type A sorting domain-containing protein [Candidatus Azobacteroides sp.]|nr:T9SS type A sorting domain-containing protein [Candidatus Azobacteroides sp.]
MRKLFLFLFFLAGIVSFSVQAKEILNINESWKFIKSNPSGAEQTGFDDSSWTSVTLPYTWNALDGQDGGGDYYRGVGWYRRQIDIPAGYANKIVYLKIGASNITTTVYVNGTLCGVHNGGYAAFMYDISDKLNFGQTNTIAIKVDNSASIVCPPLSADFTFFGGITRNVELLVAEPVHINPNEYVQNSSFVPSGLYVASSGVKVKQSNVSATSADITIITELRNGSNLSANVAVEAAIKDMQGNTVKALSDAKMISGNASTESTLAYTMSNPHLWDGLNDPYLYRVEVNVKVDGTLVDSSVQPLGLRFFSVDPNTGFSLNGKPYPLRGMCFHEDKKDKGHAVSDADRKEAIDMLAETGVNYFRIAHYQHGDFTYNYLDTLGIICWTEIPLVNSVGSTTQNETLKANAVSQMYELIHQQYNHPSVVFWGLSNEVNYQPGINPTPTIQLLNDLVKSEDTYRFTTLAAMYSEKENNWIPDVYANNRYDGWYYGNVADFGTTMDDLHARYPLAKIGVSEYGVGANINQHENYPAVKPPEGGQYHPEEFQTLFHEQYLKMINARPYLWGTSLWAGFDFASDGRNEGSQPGVNDKGLITFDHSIKKDAFYWYKANWNQKDKFVYITSRRYSPRKKNPITIHIYSNCESVSINVNGTVYDAKTSTDHIFDWSNIVLQEGENKIEATGISGGIEYKDNVTWIYEEPGTMVIPPGEIQINFEKTATVTPAGYLKDDGSIFGNRNGYNYGWNENNTGNNRERNIAADKRFDTFVQMQTSGKKYTWSIDLPNGWYSVTIACGDPSYTDSFHQMAANKVQVISFQPTADDLFGVGTNLTEVTNGKLLVEPQGSNGKINFIHITHVVDNANKIVPPDKISSYFKNGNLYIEIEPTKLYNVRLYDITGKIVFAKEIELGNKIINLPNLSQGIYLLKLNNTVVKLYNC